MFYFTEAFLRPGLTTLVSINLTLDGDLLVLPKGDIGGNNCTFDWLCRPRIEPTDNERLFVMMAGKVPEGRALRACQKSSICCFFERSSLGQ